jgi:N-methyl-L-proline demethylase
MSTTVNRAHLINDPLLTPYTLKGLALRNRIVSTSHEPAYSEDGLPKDRYIAYHVEKARGGVSLTMIGGSALVSRDSSPAFGNLQIWKDEAVPWLTRLADEVHAEGAAVMIQLSHLGHRTSNYTHEWLPAVSASDVREPAHRAFSKAAEQWDLDRILDAFVSSAQRCREAGLDGIELMVYGHFLDSFWTPFWNHRDDEYGGTYVNRMHYPLRVIAAIREAVGPDFIVGARMTFDEEREPGVKEEEALRIAEDITNAGIDFISIVRGSTETDAALARQIPYAGGAPPGVGGSDQEAAARPRYARHAHRRRPNGSLRGTGGTPGPRGHDAGAARGPVSASEGGGGH